MKMTNNYPITADLFAHIVKDIKGNAMTTSLDVARVFGKQHKNVLQAIENLDCSEEFSELNFQPTKYKDEQSKKRPMYQITRDGFTFLVMGFRGKKASDFKERYIKRFNEMEQSQGLPTDDEIRQHLTAKQIELVDMLTNENATMIKLGMNYENRKAQLTFSAIYFKVRNGLINKQGTSTAQ